jgi:hypothetical protein
MQDILKEKQKIRLVILRKLYEMSDSDVHKYVNGGELAASCGIADDMMFKTAVDYLEGECLVEVKRVSGGIPALLRIKHEGIVEVESAFSKPNEPTSHFLPVNVLYVNQMIGSSVQQGTTHSTQTSSTQISSNAKEELKKFVEIASQLLTTVDLGLPHWQEARSDVETLRIQVESPNPKPSVVRECLSSLGRLTEGATAGAIGTQLSTYIPPLLQLFA